MQEPLRGDLPNSGRSRGESQANNSAIPERFAIGEQLEGDAYNEKLKCDVGKNFFSGTQKKKKLKRSPGAGGELAAI